MTAALGLIAVLGCGPREAGRGTDNLTGAITIDGSSTVAPISEAMAEEFGALHPGVRVTVGTSGTGGGIKKFLNKEIDIADASRPIKKSEAEVAAANGIKFIELPIAFDGLTVVVNPANTWVDHLTIEELRKIWAPGSKVRLWSEVRAGWPAREIKLYGPGPDSGTFDYFTDVVNGEEGVSRDDYAASEDDNFLVTGVAGDEAALGYFGFAYYESNQEKLNAVPVVNPSTGKAVAPTVENIESGDYAPLSRPLLLYVRQDVTERQEVTEFVRFYLSKEAAQFIREVGYISLPDEVRSLVWRRYETGELGTIFEGGSKAGLSIKDLLKKEQDK